MEDQYGLAVTISGGGSEPWVFTRSDSITIRRDGGESQAVAEAAALAVFNAHAPAGTALPAIPDPVSFGAAVFQDAAISLAIRLQLMPWIPVLQQQLSDPTLIAAGWADLVAGLPIGAGDRSAIAAHAAAYNVPGIT